MPKILMEAQINKPFDHWAAVFDGDKEAQYLQYLLQSGQPDPWEKI